MKRIAALLLTFVVALAVAPVDAKDVLHLYNWNNYIAPETIKRFEALCKCDVKQTYYSDNEELLAKLAAGAKGYDILVPTGNALESLIKQQALKPIDKAALPNFKNVNQAYALRSWSSASASLSAGDRTHIRSTCHHATSPACHSHSYLGAGKFPASSPPIRSSKPSASHD